MAKRELTVSQASVIDHFFALDASETDGSGQTGLIHSDFTVYYIKASGTIAQLTPETIATIGTYQAPSANTNVRIKLVSDVNMIGVYEIHYHADLFDTLGAVAIQLRAVGAGPVNIQYEIKNAPALASALTTIAGTVGALDNTAAAGDVTEADTVMQYVKQLINILIGTPGIGTFPAEAAPGNAVSLAEVIRAIHTDVAAIEAYNLQKLFSAALDDAADNSFAAKLVDSTFGTADFSAYNWTTASLRAIREHGDQTWLTGASGGATASYTTTTWRRDAGDDDGGSGSDTVSVNGTTFNTGELNTGSYLSVDADFVVTSGETGASIDIWGFYNGGGSHYIEVRAWDNTTSQWEPLGSIGLGTVVAKHTFSLSPNHTTGTAILINMLHRGGAGVASHVLSIDKCQVNTYVPTDLSPLATSVELAKVPKSDGAVSWNSTAIAAIQNGLSTHDAADVKTAMEVDGGKLDHLWEMTEDDAGTRRLTTNALEQGPDTTTSLTLHSDYDAAKTAAQASDQMDLVDAPNGTAITAIQNGLATEAKQDIIDGVVDDIKVVTVKLDTTMEEIP